MRQTSPLSRWPALLCRIKKSSFRPTLLIALSLFVALCVIAPAHAASPRPLTLLNGDQPVSNGIWTLGNDLYIAVNTAPNTPLRATLLDEFKRPIASLSFNSGPSGRVRDLLMWFRSGVVGCDVGAGPDPIDYRFRDFDQLEASMTGRTVEVRLSDDGGKELATETLSLIADVKPRYYFSDASACPRSRFKTDEDVYLSGRNGDAGARRNAFFLVEQDQPVSEQGLILEARPSYSIVPQTTLPGYGRGSFTIFLWNQSESVLGRYGAIVRHFTGNTDYQLKGGDIGIGVLDRDGKGTHGIAIVDNECTDPTCDD